MADADRTATHFVDWVRQVEEKPYDKGFLRALREIECMHPTRPRLGVAVRPSEDPIRLGQEPATAFAPSELAELEVRTGLPPRLLVYFMGLFGPHGPLPLHLTEFARQRLRRQTSDPTFARFADMFHHRMLSLLYRASADVEPTISRDRPHHDRFAQQVGSLCGYGMESLRDRDAMPDLLKLHFAGRFALQTRNGEGIEKIIASHFEIPSRVVQFVGQWLDLPPESHWKLGMGMGSKLGGSRQDQDASRLGVTTTLGSRVWQCQQKFRIVLGPMKYDSYRRFLPGSDGLDRLIAIVKNYLGDEFLWDLNLILEKNEVPQLNLGGGSQLGWTSWVAGQPLSKDDDSACFTPLEQAG